MSKFMPVIFLLFISFSAISADSPPKKVGIDEWGLGFGLGVEQYKNTYIDEASLRGDTRIVTTEKTYDTRPSAWLTLNWNVWGWEDSKEMMIRGVKTKIEDRDIRYGFFAGVKLIDGNSESFSAFALGPQISFLIDEREISVGLGWVTHQTREFANGIVSGQSLPTQYDDIVFEEGTENSYMLMISVTF